MNKSLLILMSLISFNISLNAQNVYIPDANFKAYLVSNSSINTNADTEIQVSEAAAYSGSISCANYGVADLTGIQAFENITHLQAYSNPITGTLDLTQNTKIRQLLLESTQIEGVLDLSTMTELTDVKIHSTSVTAVNMANGNNNNVTRFEAQGSDVLCVQTDNGFTANSAWLIPSTASYSTSPCPQFCTINIPDANFKAYLIGNASINTDGGSEIECSEATAFTGMININGAGVSDLTGLESFTNLTTLSCNDNGLTSLDISANTALTDLYCSYNSLTSLDVSSNLNIETIESTNNNLTHINLASSNSLTFINVIDNEFTSFDFTNLTALEGFRCSYNQLTSLDLSSLTSLNQLYCDNNELVSLDVSNGNNINFWTNPGGTYRFSASSNPNLTCIQVDNAVWSTTNWTDIDATTSFSENCIVLVNSISVQGQGGVSTITTNGGTLQMEAAVLPANADDATYTWSLVNGTGAATIDANGLLTASADGTVEVTATANDASGTVGTKTITISNQSVGINDLAFENLNIFPNPTNGILNLEIVEDLSSIKIMDLTGKTIQFFNPEKTQLDISSFTSGVYFLEIANTEKKSVIKIIKQ